MQSLFNLSVLSVVYRDWLLIYVVQFKPRGSDFNSCVLTAEYVFGFFLLSRVQCQTFFSICLATELVCNFDIYICWPCCLFDLMFVFVMLKFSDCWIGDLLISFRIGNCQFRALSLLFCIKFTRFSVPLNAVKNQQIVCIKWALDFS